MKLRVIHYVDDYYIVQIKRGIFSMWMDYWHRWLHYDSLRLIKEKSPVLMSFEDAKSLAHNVLDHTDNHILRISISYGNP